MPGFFAGCAALLILAIAGEVVILPAFCTDDSRLFRILPAVQDLALQPSTVAKAW